MNKLDIIEQKLKTHCFDVERINNTTIRFVIETVVNIETKTYHIRSINTSWWVSETGQITSVGGSNVRTHAPGADYSFVEIDSQIECDRINIQNILNNE